MCGQSLCGVKLEEGVKQVNERASRVLHTLHDEVLHGSERSTMIEHLLQRARQTVRAAINESKTFLLLGEACGLQNRAEQARLQSSAVNGSHWQGIMQYGRRNVARQTMA